MQYLWRISEQLNSLFNYFCTDSIIKHTGNIHMNKYWDTSRVKLIFIGLLPSEIIIFKHFSSLYYSRVRLITPEDDENDWNTIPWLTSIYLVAWKEESTCSKGEQLNDIMLLLAIIHGIFSLNPEENKVAQRGIWGVAVVEYPWRHTIVSTKEEWSWALLQKWCGCCSLLNTIYLFYFI